MRNDEAARAATNSVLSMQEEAHQEKRRELNKKKVEVDVNALKPENKFSNDARGSPRDVTS